MRRRQRLKRCRRPPVPFRQNGCEFGRIHPHTNVRLRRSFSKKKASHGKCCAGGAATNKMSALLARVSKPTMTPQDYHRAVLKRRATIGRAADIAPGMSFKIIERSASAN